MRTSLLILAIALAGCDSHLLGGGDPLPANSSGYDGVLIVDAPAQADGPGISVQAALDHAGDDAVLVRGALFVDDAYGYVWLCTRARASSLPRPECEGPSLLVQDRTSAAGRLVSEDIAALVGRASVHELHKSSTVRWAEDAAFFGRVVESSTDQGSGS